MLRNTVISAILLSATAFASGCFTKSVDEPADPAVEENRGPIGKGDHYGQCMEIDMRFCGTKSSGNCWCDELCEYYGDCCSDYEEECVDEEDTCDATQICGYALTCVDGDLYPTTCGASNCDEPIGDCGEPEGQACGGWLGDTCDTDEFCSFSKNAICGWADASGTCETIPEPVCPEIYAPVCGCNGQDYTSECDANAAGTSVQKSGSCDCNEGSVKMYCWGQWQCTPIGAQC